MREVLETFLNVFSIFVLGYFVIINAYYLLTIGIAFRTLGRYARRLKFMSIEDLVGSSGAPPITLLAPAFNEEATCVESVKSLLTLTYPDYEVIVINDGSKDQTIEVLKEAYNLEEASRAPTAFIKTNDVRAVYRSTTHSRLWVIDKENGGKSDALNAGLNYCRTPLFCAMDADSLLERDALMRIVRPFLEDATTIAAGGIIRIVNGCKVEAGLVKDVRLPSTMLPSLQIVEYLRAFLSGRVGLDAMNANLIISGAFGVFKRSIAVEVGGYATDTVGEDMELVVRFHHHCRSNKIPYRICFVPDPVAWTECPESLKVLGRQRDRWHRGMTQVMWRHRRMFCNPRYGAIGLIAYPYFFLELIGPVIELLGYIMFGCTLAFGLISLPHFTAFFAVAFLLGIALSIAAVGLEELTFRRYGRFKDLIRLFGLAVIENLGYRQLTVYWRVRGLLSAFAAKKAKSWGTMERKGFARKTEKVQRKPALHVSARMTTGLVKARKETETL